MKPYFSGVREHPKKQVVQLSNKDKIYMQWVKMASAEQFVAKIA
jgi:hypothetical protein